MWLINITIDMLVAWKKNALFVKSYYPNALQIVKNIFLFKILIIYCTNINFRLLYRTITFNTAKL